MGAGFGRRRFEPGALVATFNAPLKEKYDVIKTLGSGAQGTTYLVKCRKTGKERVAKECHDFKEQGAELMEEFEKMKELRHPNCARVLELIQSREWIGGERKEQLVVISEFACGADLYNYMQKVIGSSHKLTEEWVAGVFAQAMGGVAYLHGRGIEHNDLKPDNILMMEEFSSAKPDHVPRVVIGDYGMATFPQDYCFCSGDPRYQSPESWAVMGRTMEGEGIPFWARKVGPAGDVWSMGATLFELLSGGLIPFLYEPVRLQEFFFNGAMKRDRILERVEEGIQVRPHCADVSQEAEDLLQQLLRKDPEQRPTANEALDHPWFAIKSKRVNDDTVRKIQFKATKGMAHTVLLNALATKLRHDHCKECWEVFCKLDVSRTGRITLEEFEEGFTEILEMPSDRDPLRQRLSSFRSFANDGPQDKRQILHSFRASLPVNSCDHNLAGSFRARAQTDSLDRTALQTFCTRVPLTSVDLKAYFERADVDGDGALDFQEFTAITFDWHALDPGVLEENLESVFNQLDADGNGFVSEDEIAKLFQGCLDRDEITELFKLIDVNGDGLLSKEELNTFLFERVSAEEMKRFQAITEAPKDAVKSKAVCGCFCLSGLWKLL